MEEKAIMTISRPERRDRRLLLFEGELQREK